MLRELRLESQQPMMKNPKLVKLHCKVVLPSSYTTSYRAFAIILPLNSLDQD